MELNRFPLDQRRFKRLDTKAMESRRPVEQYRVFTNHFVENIPDFRPLFLDHLLGTLNGRRMPALFEVVVNKGLEQFERHMLRQPALMEAQFRPNNDNRPA